MEVVRESEARSESVKLDGAAGGGGGACTGVAGGGGGVVVMVLVVDDSPVERRTVEALLKGSTGAMFQVIAVDSEKKAMEILGLEQGKAKSATVTDQKIDIVLTDFLKAVKEQICPISIPVVVMSSENEPQRISRCREIGAEDFILKPLQSRDVHRLRNYARPTTLAHKAGAKRKVPLDFRPENSSSSGRKSSRRVGLAVA